MTGILITSSVLILAIVLLRKLFSGSLSRRVQYALWGLILLRLLLPVQLPMMNFSVLNAAKPVEHVVTKTVAEQPIYVPVAQAPLEEQPKARIAKPENTLIKEGQSVWIADTERETAVQYKRVSPATVLSWVWTAGSCIVGAFLLLANLRFWLWLRKARKPYEAADCKLRVFLVEAGLPSPCLFGLFRPAIYLTPAALESKTKLRHVLAHELTHARHLDHLWTLLRGVCLALYWFDPLVWVAAAVSNADCELACDEGALARLSDDDRIPYGKTLLSLVPVRQTANPLLATTAMVAGKRQLKDRFMRIAKRSRQTVAAVVAVAVLVAAVSACTFTGGDPGGEKVIHLVTDLGHNAKFHTGVEDDTDLAQYALEQAMEKLGTLPVGYRVEVEVLPTNEADYQSRLTRIRTEIMSGEGPDIFLLSTDDLPRLNPQEHLFPDAQKAMADNLFLPLDDYVKSAKFMEFDKMNPTIMEAGCTADGRLILPMHYTYGAVRTTLPLADNGVSWTDAMNAADGTLASLYASATDLYFHTIFPETVNYESKTLRFSKEELYDAVSKAIARRDNDRERDGTIRGLVVDGTINETTADYSPPWDATLKDSVVYLPLRNKEGGVSATVTSYIAINKNTPHPDEAFHVVDVIMSRRFQSGAKFWDEGRYYGTTSAIAVFSWSTGVTVYDDLMTESQPVNYDYWIPDELFPAYCELRDKITDARVRTNVDQALDDLFFHAWLDDMMPGEELEKYVSKEYDKMLLMAGEL